MLYSSVFPKSYLLIMMEYVLSNKEETKFPNNLVAVRVVIYRY